MVSSNKKRTGKWTKEELLYARALIGCFEAGVLSDVAEGTAVRVWLAEQLQCAPMRISKKYVGGNCLGRLKYQHKDNRERSEMMKLLLRLRRRRDNWLQQQTPQHKLSREFEQACYNNQSPPPPSPLPSLPLLHRTTQPPLLNCISSTDYYYSSSDSQIQLLTDSGRQFISYDELHVAAD